jgi:hypothetical protein
MQDNNRVADLWAAFEEAFSKANESLGNPEGLRLYAHPKRPTPEEWSATVGRPPADVNEITEDLRRAGLALLDLAKALPLVVGERPNICEVLSAHITDYDGSLWLDVHSPTENASVKLLTGVDEVIQFVQSRDFGDDDSDWARAARTRCVRKTVFGDFDLIEPGAVWFIEWLEQHGAKTIFSCEGHPHDFHVTFRGSYEIAHALAGVENLDVYVFRSKSYPEKDQWKMELSYWPDSREERDKALRKLAESLAKLRIRRSLWQRIRQYLPFPV